MWSRSGWYRHKQRRSAAPSILDINIASNVANAPSPRGTTDGALLDDQVQQDCGGDSPDRMATVIPDYEHDAEDQEYGDCLAGLLELDEEGDHDDEEVDQQDPLGATNDQLPLLRHHALPAPLRLAYIRAAYDRVKGTSFENTDLNLKISLASLGFMGGTDLALDHQHSHTTRTRTALSRIGADPEEFIEQYIVCPNPQCWNIIRPSKLYSRSARCGAKIEVGKKRKECDEKLFEIRNGNRIPFRVIPYTRLSTALTLLLQDQHVVDNLQHWRNPTDPEDAITDDPSPPPRRPGNSAKSGKSVRLDIPYRTPHYAMQGFWDGTMWRAQRANVERDFDPITGKVSERRWSKQGPWKHSSLEYGLKIILNIDWCVVCLVFATRNCF
jgi:hypothetical protein